MLRYSRLTALTLPPIMRLIMDFDLIHAPLWLVFFIFSATVHEAAHAWAAKLGGDLTAYRGGQVSLDPIPHIKRAPLGMVVLPLISSLLLGWPFGYAVTPYDPDWAEAHPRKAALMGLAGPAANLVLVILCVIFIRVGIAEGVFVEPEIANFLHIVDSASPGVWAGIATAVSMLFVLNLILVILNLLPLPPLDGASAITLLFPEETAQKIRPVIMNPMFGFVGLLIAWYAFTPLFKFLLPGVLNMMYPGSGYYWS
jgi:Zn-dependent protease